MSERGQIALQLVAVAVVLGAAVYGIVASASAQPPPVASIGAGPDASLIASTVRSPTPSPSPTFVTLPPATATAPTPAPTRRPMSLRAYAFGGHAYTGVDLGAGWTALAPFDGRLELHTYQLIDNVIREFTSVAGVPTYPYVIVTAADGRKLTYRPGALSTDTALLGRAGPVKVGDELFRVTGDGRSSWAGFYDASVTFQIVVSLSSAAGADLDATSLIKVR